MKKSLLFALLLLPGLVFAQCVYKPGSYQGIQIMDGVTNVPLGCVTSPIYVQSSSSSPTNVTGTVTANQGNASALTYNNAWPVKMVNLTVTGTLAGAGQAVTINTSGLGSVGIHVANGLTVNTVLRVEGVVTGGTFTRLRFYDVVANTYVDQYTVGSSTPPMFLVDAAGFDQLRVRVESYAGGSGVATLSGSQSALSLGVQNGGYVFNSSMEVLENSPTFTGGTITISTSGTAQRLDSGSALTVPFGGLLTIAALSSNAGVIRIGETQVRAQANATARVLSPGMSVYYNVSTSTNFWVDGSFNTDNVTFSLEQN